MESRLGRAILLYRLYHLEQLADGWWQFVAQEAEVGLPGAADGAQERIVLDEVMYEPHRVELVATRELCTFVVWCHLVDDQVA